MREKRTSRILNDQTYFLGLSYNDITGVGIFVLLLLIVGKFFKIEFGFWALSIAGIMLGFLIPIRMQFRRKIIRDALQYLVQNGVFNVSKNRRIKKR
jgi:hypothetical protein